MRFYSDEFPVPELFRDDEFVLRPLRASDVELDFDAVIPSSAMLRTWSQSDWPADGFTLEENLVDLQWHEQEHLDKKAFTYTIMNPEETFCLGCIYVKPLSQEMVELGVCPPSDQDVEMVAASVRYWVRESHATREFNSAILEGIIEWFESEWYFNCVVFPVATAVSIQTKLFVERGFVLAGDIYYESWNSRWNIYQKNSG